MRKIYIIALLFVSITLPVSASLTPKDVNGRWIFKHNSAYGYEFTFTDSKFADIIIFMNSNFLLFRGIYKINDPDTISIEVLEMKYTPSLKDIRAGKDLTKTTSSFMTFDAEKSSSGGKTWLLLKKKSIKIDGNSSDGFFEPEIRLKKE